jgi:hypothetical protein
MPFAYIAGATILGSVLQSNAAKSAASTQANAANNAAALQQQEFNTINQQQAPYRQAGYTALNQIGQMTPYLTQQFGPQQLQSNLAPNYQFMLGQGTGANTQAMNAGGGGSNVQRSNQIFGENYASNAYQNAFNNYQTQRQNIYNTLASIAGIGQTGQTATNAAGLTTAGNIGQAGISAASSLAAGQVGSTGALASGLQGATNAYSLPGIYQYAQSLNPANQVGAQTGGDQWS